MRQYIELPIKFVNIEDEGFHIITEGLINGKEARFVIDTGASRTVFDKKKILNYIDSPEFSKKEGLSAGIGGVDIYSFVFIIDKLSFGGLIIRDYQCVAMDLSNINDSYEKINLTGIDGVIGGDILKKYKAIINYKAKKIRFSIK